MLRVNFINRHNINAGGEIDKVPMKIYINLPALSSNAETAHFIRTSLG